MGTAAETRAMSAGEYLTWERDQPCKHEFHEGEVFAMAGASPRHNVLANAVGAELRAALRGRGCQVMNSDQRVSAKAGERYVYPDAVAACGGARMEAGTSDVLANPAVVVEVLSRSTEAYDRGEKWEAYQRLPSVMDYLLVSQSAMRVEHYARDDDGSWKYRELGPGERVILTNGASLSVDAVYEGAFDIVAD